MSNLRKPKSYLREISVSKNNSLVAEILATEKINTICENANCPNRAECFSDSTASILALGSICTRNCKFCAVKKGKPQPIDETEPQRIANAVKKLNLASVVITSPTRDDLEDGGAKHLSNCVLAVKKGCPNCKVELLIPDFKGNEKLLDIILNSSVDCISHNIEMPKNLYSKLRDFADFERSINILKYIKQNSNILIKTGFMLGLGETEEEIYNLIKIIAEIQNESSTTLVLTIGQYFQPTKISFPVQKYYEENDFLKFADFAKKLGIKKVFSGVFIRSSYKNNIF